MPQNGDTIVTGENIIQQRLVIIRLGEQIVSALFSERELVELHLEESEEKSLLGNIYVGKVKNIVKNINAAFVEIADGRMCYLSLAKELNPFRKNSQNRKPGEILQGDEFLVQISKEDVKTKAPVVTTELSLTGKYLVLTRAKTMLGLSSKIENLERRQQLKELIQPYLSEEFGFILRTNAANAADELIVQEANILIKRYQQLLRDGTYQNRFSLIYQTPPAFLCAIRDGYAEGLTEILTDDEEIHKKIQEYLTCFQPEDIRKLRLFSDSSISLDRLYGIRTKLKDALREKVWLKSGGYLVIQPTEALTVIDVNSGKAVSKKKNVQETFFKLNVEAAKVIAKQIRLRNLSGIILIDFINMQEETRKEELLRTLREAVKADPIKTTVVDITALYLVELTRKKVRRPLYEQFNAEDIEKGLN